MMNIKMRDSLSSKWLSNHTSLSLMLEGRILLLRAVSLAIISHAVTILDLAHVRAVETCSVVWSFLTRPKTFNKLILQGPPLNNNSNSSKLSTSLEVPPSHNNSFNSKFPVSTLCNNRCSNKRHRWWWMRRRLNNSSSCWTNNSN